MKESDWINAINKILTSDDGSPILSVLYSSTWTRVILVREKVGESLNLEVELSPSVQENNVGSDCLGDDIQQDKVVNRFSSLIDHLRYMITLHEHGFILKSCEEDCLWIAYYPITDAIHPVIYHILTPPEGGMMSVNHEWR